MQVFWDYIGRTRYSKCFDLQNRIRESVLSGSPSRVLLTEHERVFTFGRREDGRNLHFPTAHLENLGFDIVKTNRGGLVTYHGPGQLVIYPIVNLKGLRLKVKEYVRNLELSVVKTLEGYGIETERKEGFPGVWIGAKKIGSLGIHVKRLVTLHGFALNAYTNLSDFGFINPCGFGDIEVTSMEKEGAKNVSLEKLAQDFMISFSKIFEVDCIRGSFDQNLLNSNV